MKLSLQKDDLVRYVCRQLNNSFPDGKEVSPASLHRRIDRVLERIEYCFSKVNTKYFFDGQQSVFNHLHADQYCIFLYYLGNTFYRENDDIDISAKTYLLNKALHGLDAFYEVSLPDIFLVVHPLATVLGRGSYNDYFIVYQRCGIGSNNDIYPEIGRHVTMHPGSAVLGNSKIGDNCKIAAESLVLDRSLEAGTLYVGNPKSHFLRPSLKISALWRS